MVLRSLAPVRAFNIILYPISWLTLVLSDINIKDIRDLISILALSISNQNESSYSIIYATQRETILVIFNTNVFFNLHEDFICTLHEFTCMLLSVTEQGIVTVQDILYF